MYLRGNQSVADMMSLLTLHEELYYSVLVNLAHKNSYHDNHNNELHYHDARFCIIARP